MRAQQRVDYDVVLVDGLFDVDNRILLEAGGSAGDTLRRFVVVDDVVDRLYGSRIREYFAHHGVESRIMAMAVSEQAKTLDAVSRIVAGFDEFGLDRRREPVIGIGGGVLLDTLGVAAGLYRRGIPYIRVPTTLIGLVDAGVGVKTAVNHGQHKNRLGSYYAPVAALLDREFLRTLDERHVVNGLAEILKIALIRDECLFELLETHGGLLVEQRFAGRPAGSSAGDGDDVAFEVLDRATTGMLDELRPNLWEKVLDRLVDYGHSISPTIEMLALPELLHGEAVAIDMSLFTVLACRRGLVTRHQRDRILRVVRDLGLPTRHPLLEPAVLSRALADTVRHRDGMQRMPMPVGIGAGCFVNDISESELALAAKELHELEVDGG